MKVRKVGGIAVIAPSGWLMGGDETDKIEKTIRDLLEAGNRCLLVNLGEVQMMNSTAIGMLVGARTSYANREGALKLCNVDKRINHIFVVAKLSLIFDVFPSEQEAIASFEAGKCPEAK